MVDWTKPIEAVHTDGRVVAVTLAKGPDGRGDYQTTECPDLSTANTWWDSLGASRVPRCPWSIRNVTPAWRTCDEQLDRMDALVQKLATHDLNMGMIQEARAIIAAREPVDPRFATVQNAIVNSLTHDTLPTATVMRMTRDVLAALDK